VLDNLRARSEYADSFKFLLDVDSRALAAAAAARRRGL
jgi:hypothetical protein